jgi:DNA polymerase-3 subunit delta
LILSNEFKNNKNIDLTISSAKPPIFWKDKEITKQQIYKWTPEKIRLLLYRLNEIELLIKKNFNNSVNLITDFILDQASSSANN